MKHRSPCPELGTHALLDTQRIPMSDRRVQSGSVRGFTLVEMIVVIGVVAVLMAILLPALLGARSSARKADELSSIRQVGAAWANYIDYAKNRLLPGYLEPQVQEAWRVSYKIAYDGSEVPRSDAAPYPWRLLPYLSNQHVMVLSPRHTLTDDPRSQLTSIAYEPAFGYNALYLGGWYERVEADGRPTVRFELSNTIAWTFNAIRVAEQQVVFASSTVKNGGLSFDGMEDNAAGSHFVVPPTVAQTPQWTASGAAITVVQGGPGAPVPAGRYTSQIAVVFADGHVNAEGAGALFDQRKWIPVADRADYTHVP
ncbi:MAG: prepilin-type N-terminal cleavage/methylation domain-containing protein [Phycisphaeraceae bacterium]|nr:prepilin-type N-terminal cleavage/methylation domain-containing protein [Phycisphaerales bacterium]QOJ18099.1 MAG: prepilin-type N-terminal cleavage/methylation domain-containing protein [Phycisphaeraceae bacterium]